MVSGLDAAASAAHFEKVRQSVAALRLPFGDSVLSMTVSIGVCRMPLRSGNLHSLITEADRQLYLAKAAGRNRVCSADTH
jgi:diguanylate cyclase (GGDEF)-like protein